MKRFGGYRNCIFLRAQRFRGYSRCICKTAVSQRQRENPLSLHMPIFPSMVSNDESQIVPALNAHMKPPLRFSLSHPTPGGAKHIPLTLGAPIRALKQQKTPPEICPFFRSMVSNETVYLYYFLLAGKGNQERQKMMIIIY